MTNREYLAELSDDLFGSNLTVEEIIRIPKYLEFEHDVEEIIKKDFERIGCDTSVGEPTWLGMELWMTSEAKKEMKEMLEKKYKILQ